MNSYCVISRQGIAGPMMLMFGKGLWNLNKILNLFRMGRFNSPSLPLFLPLFSFPFLLLSQPTSFISLIKIKLHWPNGTILLPWLLGSWVRRITHSRPAWVTDKFKVVLGKLVRTSLNLRMGKRARGVTQCLLVCQFPSTVKWTNELKSANAH